MRMKSELVTITTFLVLASVAIAAVAGTTTSNTTAVYAQTTTNTTAATTTTTQQIISDVQTACSEVTPSVIAVLCVSVIHESPTTVVLDGQLLIVQQAGRGTGEAGLVDNPFIWQAVDRFKVQGYTLNSVQLGGQGSQGNPHTWYIVMSK